jgi:type II secretory pathway pseudopilin PulG
MFKGEKGIGLIEAMVAMALLGIIGVALLSGTATTTTARVTADEHASAKVLAESAIEQIKKEPYDTTYAFTVPPEYAGYEVQLTVDSLMSGALQSVTVAVERRGRVVLSLETYKANR